ncbi:flavin reductase family protein [Couchioplanes caeruleus]|uniref:Flavin reductase (DIM6/NTAB) family NADH-FMN oxidoreductase RutF n=1 Tax=Couchioplanes caeruleus TaxID=56438 RepID=A0A3N1GMA0_9ACTN|nr:flavin reductase family protein [Couchioplanes caeruleus]ROP31358.1 flavin reductase (DIM6/NTAB) family NADH-FMN oxidoreductase RutF [Couchioplanes caeruleus]
MIQQDEVRFRAVLGHYTTGVAVIAGLAESGPVGLAVNSFTAVSLRPLLVSFCVSHSSSSWRMVRHGGRFSVNVLSEHQRELCQRMATPAQDKFEGVDWFLSAQGIPGLSGAIARLECTTDVVYPAGDHDIVIAAVDNLEADEGPNGPLVFYRGDYGRFSPFERSPICQLRPDS